MDVEYYWCVARSKETRNYELLILRIGADYDDTLSPWDLPRAFMAAATQQLENFIATYIAIAEQYLKDLGHAGV